MITAILFTLLRWVRGMEYFLVKVMEKKEWGGKKVPLYYSHQIDLGRWAFKGKDPRFLLRGVQPLFFLKEKDSLLELASGDGFYARYFWGPLVQETHCLEGSAKAYAYAKKWHGGKGITYYHGDMVKDPFPKKNYHHIVLNAALYYVSLEEAEKLMKKVQEHLAEGGFFWGMVPLANGHKDHQFEFKTPKELENFLGKYFSSVSLVAPYSTGKNHNIYFKASCEHPS